MITDKNKIIEMMREKRIREGLSQRKLSDEIGLSFSILSRMERGKGLPSHVSIAKINHWLGEISYEELISIIENNARPGPYSRLFRIENKIDEILKIISE